VVAEGDTVAEPEAGSPDPTPLSMLTEVAFVEFQLSVELPPAAMELGEAVSEIEGAVADTVIFSCTLVVPPDPVAVAV
jgi:hypothetical protein